MRKLFKYDDGFVYEKIIVSSKEKLQIRMTQSEADALVVSGDAVLYDTNDELDATIKYKEDRGKAYPGIEEQLDKMYHSGYDGWKETIKAVKDAHPKP